MRLLVMITLVRSLLLVSGGALLIIGVIDVSTRAMVIGVALMVAAAAAHRRSRALWWIVSGALAFFFFASLRGFFRGPQTPLAYMCSTLGTLLLALISSWWFRLKAHFNDSLTSR
jgi:hypothetical protein